MTLSPLDGIRLRQGALEAALRTAVPGENHHDVLCRAEDYLEFLNPEDFDDDEGDDTFPHSPLQAAH